MNIVKRIGIRCTSDGYSRRLLKERDAEQIDLLGANPPTVFVGKWCSRLRIIRCHNSNNSFSIRRKHHATPRAVLTTPASEPTTKKVPTLQTIYIKSFFLTLVLFLFKFPNWETELIISQIRLGVLCRGSLNLPSRR